MTIIAFKDGIIAGDTLCRWDGIRVWYQEKIIIAFDGVVAAAAGTTSDCYAFEKWIKGGRVGEPLRFGDTFEALWFLPNGEIWGGDGVGVHNIPRDVEFLTIGCASKFGSGAMAAGCSARRAVELCIRYHDGCGGEVQTAVLKDAFKNINQASEKVGMING